MAVFVLALALLVQVVRVSTICMQITEFDACMTKYSTKVADCSSAVVGTPDVAYYSCQCTELTAMQQCYMVCPDDEQMQLQLRTQQSTTSAVCQAVNDLRSRGHLENATESIKSDINSKVSIATKVLPKPSKTAQLSSTQTPPPKPSSQSKPDNGSNGILVVNSATKEHTLFGPFEVFVAAFVGVLVM